MSLIRSRASRAGRSAATGAPRTLSVAVTLVVALGLLLVAGCGMNAQTSKPYTSAEGINIDVGNPAQNNLLVHVRNLLVIAGMLVLFAAALVVPFPHGDEGDDV